MSQLKFTVRKMSGFVIQEEAKKTVTQAQSYLMLNYQTPI